MSGILTNISLKIDIIIPTKQIGPYVREAISEILQLDYGNYGIILFPDESNGETFPKTHIVPTGPVGPAEKRDRALSCSDAEVLAFLDDDAFPRKNWLKNAARHFLDPQVAAVGGPAITPEGDSFKQRVSGAVFLSRLGAGFPERYWPVGQVREIIDWPSVNLLVRKDAFQEVGGFNSAYWPGEDTKLCLDIIKSGKKILYDPEAVVYHHRREGLLRHLRQIGRYGLHRGFFAKTFPATSFRIKYFIPSSVALFFAFGLTVPFWGHKFLTNLYFFGIFIYVGVLMVVFIQIWSRQKKMAVALVSVPYVFLTHIWYGIRFLQGFLLTKDLKSKLRKIK
jgi:cellulose synthase/poly-beta-1,6-N-acetylglucosamine synthase-like glycosyltransferase